MDKKEPKQIFMNCWGSTYSNRINRHAGEERGKAITEAGFGIDRAVSIDHYVFGETRVRAYMFDDEGKIQIIGNGVLEGWEKVPIVNEDDETEVLMELDTPKIKLDNGKYVYGFQCWWCTLPEWAGISKGIEMSEHEVIWEDEASEQ